MGDVIEFDPQKSAEREHDETLTALTSAEHWLTECLKHFDDGTVDKVALQRALDCVYAVRQGFLTTWELRGHGIKPDRRMRPTFKLDDED